MGKHNRNKLRIRKIRAAVSGSRKPAAIPSQKENIVPCTDSNHLKITKCVDPLKTLRSGRQILGDPVSNFETYQSFTRCLLNGVKRSVKQNKSDGSPSKQHVSSRAFRVLRTQKNAELKKAKKIEGKQNFCKVLCVKVLPLLDEEIQMIHVSIAIVASEQFSVSAFHDIAQNLLLRSTNNIKKCILFTTSTFKSDLCKIFSNEDSTDCIVFYPLNGITITSGFSTDDYAHYNPSVNHALFNNILAVENILDSDLQIRVNCNLSSPIFGQIILIPSNTKKRVTAAKNDNISGSSLDEIADFLGDCTLQSLDQIPYENLIFNELF